jgi:membrane-associated protein
MLDPITIIQTVGLIGIILIIFSETGLFFGFFFPGDSLLFTAGLFASQGFFSIEVLLISCALAAILGDSVGYWTGKKYGRELFKQNSNFFFKKKRLEEAEVFYQKHGKYTIIIARFIPIIRTFAPIVAGLGRMHYKTFLSYNILGGISWTTSFLLISYFLGGMIPNLDKYLIPITILIILISILPIIVKMARYKIENSI